MLWRHHRCFYPFPLAFNSYVKFIKTLFFSYRILHPKGWSEEDWWSLQLKILVEHLLHNMGLVDRVKGQQPQRTLECHMSGTLKLKCRMELEAMLRERASPRRLKAHSSLTCSRSVEMHDWQRLIVWQEVMIFLRWDTVCSGKDTVNSCSSLRCVAVPYKQKVRFGREVEVGRVVSCVDGGPHGAACEIGWGRMK